MDANNEKIWEKIDNVIREMETPYPNVGKVLSEFMYVLIVLFVLSCLQIEQNEQN